MTFPSLVPFATNELLPDPSGRSDGATYMGGALTSVRGVVFHVNAGNGDPRNWWSSPTNHNVASAHLQIMKTGELKQYVPLNRVAWAEVAGNGEWHSVETEGFPTEPLTDAQFETFAKLLAWGHTACGWPLQVTDSVTGYGIGTHQMGGAAWGGHACPGPIRAGQRPALIARAQQLLAPPPPVQEDDDMPLIVNIPTGNGTAIWLKDGLAYTMLHEGASVTSLKAAGVKSITWSLNEHNAQLAAIRALLATPPTA